MQRSLNFCEIFFQGSRTTSNCFSIRQQNFFRTYSSPKLMITFVNKHWFSFLLLGCFIIICTIHTYLPITYFSLGIFLWCFYFMYIYYIFYINLYFYKHIFFTLCWTITRKIQSPALINCLFCVDFQVY